MNGPPERTCTCTPVSTPDAISGPVTVPASASIVGSGPISSYSQPCSASGFQSVWMEMVAGHTPDRSPPAAAPDEPPPLVPAAFDGASLPGVGATAEPGASVAGASLPGAALPGAAGASVAGAIVAGGALAAGSGAVVPAWARPAAESARTAAAGSRSSRRDRVGVMWVPPVRGRWWVDGDRRDRGSGTRGRFVPAADDRLLQPAEEEEDGDAEQRRQQQGAPRVGELVARPVLVHQDADALGALTVEQLADDHADHGEAGGDSQSGEDRREGRGELKLREAGPRRDALEREQVVLAALHGAQPEQGVRDDRHDRDDHADDHPGVLLVPEDRPEDRRDDEDRHRLEGDQV